MRTIHTLSFVVPAVIFAVMLALMGLFPFGDRQILVVDAWHQYYPFISDLWHTLRGGGSLLWSWTSGGGHDYLGQIGYYLASPFNFLAVLFPHSWLLEVVTAFVVVRVGLAGLFMSIYLRYLSKKPDMMIVAFSTFYALCAWIIAFYWNFMWLDTFVLLPLVAVGTHQLVAENKYKLLVISLALSVIFNFYMGFFTCVFVAIMFFVLSASYKMSIKTFFVKLVFIGVVSVVALGMAAFIVLPVIEALGHTGRTEPVFPGWTMTHGFVDLVGNFATLMPTARAPHGGFPNIYAGFLSLMFYPVFLISKISLREKIAFSVACAFILVSTTIPNLNFAWHGFSATHGLPYRYSFIASFLLIIMAYRGYTAMRAQGLKIGHLAALGLGGAGFLSLTFIGAHDTIHAYWLMIFGLVYLAVFVILWGFGDSPQNRGTVPWIRQAAVIAIAVIAAGEVSLASHVGLVQGGDTTARSPYPWAFNDVQTVLDQRNLPENGFYRTDFTARWSHNDPALYNIQGISFFSSMVNQNTLRFMNGLGLVNWAAANSYAFAETSPLTSAVLNVRYLVDRGGNPADDGAFWERAATASNVLLMENTRHLPLGFMTRPELANYVGDIHNPFNSQNNFFRLATGLDGNIFTLLSVSYADHENLNVTSSNGTHWNFRMDEGETHGTFRFYYRMPHDGDIYAYFHITQTDGITIDVDYDRRFLRTVATTHNAPHLFRVATLEDGEMFRFTTETTRATGTANTFVGILNRELFDTGFDILAAEVWELTSFRDTRISGYVTTHEGGILFTSIPYTRNWRATVGGERVDVIAIDGAMSAIRLPAGTHHVTFSYHNTSFALGGAISLISLAVFALSFKIKIVRK